MNKKLVYLSLVTFFSFSFASCGGLERKVDVDTGKEIVEKAINSSKTYIDTIIDGSFISFDLNAIINANMDLKKEKIENNSTIMENHINLESLFEYKSNLDLNGLNKEVADLSNCSSYLLSNYSYTSDNKTTTINEKIYREATRVSTVDANGQIDIDTMEAEQVKDFANTINYFVNDFSVEEFIIDVFPNMNDHSYKKIKSQYEKFANEEITAKQFIDNIDLYVFSGTLFDNSTPGTYECCIKLLENIEDLLPHNYFDYTKSQSSSLMTLKAKFDFKDWAENASKTLKKIIEELKEEKSSYDMINTIQQDILENLPDKFAFDFSISIDKENIIKNFKLNFIANGSLENINSLLLKAEDRLIYDINLSMDVSLDILDKKIEVPKIELAEKK